jgi:hypothetical protein
MVREVGNDRRRSISVDQVGQHDHVRENVSFCLFWLARPAVGREEGERPISQQPYAAIRPPAGG